MSEPSQISRSLIIIDAPEEVQAWADEFVALAVAGDLPIWPSHHHTLPRTTVITVASLWKAINSSFILPDGTVWSVAVNGLPPFSAPESLIGTSELEKAVEVASLVSDPEPEDNRGGPWHNMLHSILGNFH